jgi:hypothetical protein
MVRVGDETILVDEFGCRTEALNRTASLVWQCLDGVSCLGDIAADLAEAFGVDRTVVLSEVRELVGTLSQRRFVVDLADMPAIEPPGSEPDFSGVPPNH